MLVGDILLSAREAVPDLPGTLIAPVQTDINAAPGIITGGQLVKGATYFLVFTYATLWGETPPGPEISVTIPGSGGLGGGILCNPAGSPYAMMGNALSAVAGGNLFFNVYLGTVSGGETAKYTFPLVGIENFVGGVSGSFALATPPTGNSAFLLDSSGPVASASQAFRWLTDALKALAAANGGIPDQGGFGTIIGRQNYQVPGHWESLEAAWYDGYPMNMGSARLVFRHNGLNGQVAQMSFTQVSDFLICELYPQPLRTAGATALSGPIGITDTTAPTVGSGGFVLPLGLAMLGAPPTYEIVSFAGTNGGLQQLIRGLGGTSGQAWATGTGVTELNCMFTGMRSPQIYTVGQAANTILIPSAWTPYVHLYILARYRAIEQQQQEATSLMKEFDTYVKSVSKRKPILGERQIQPSDDIGLDVRPGLSSTFGGVIVP